MKLNHFTMVFIIAYLLVIPAADLYISRVVENYSDEKYIDECLATACRSAAWELGGHSGADDTENAYSSFVTVLAAALGQTDPLYDKQIESYIPVFLVAGNSGVTVVHTAFCEENEGRIGTVSREIEDTIEYIWKEEYIYRFCLDGFTEVIDKDGQIIDSGFLCREDKDLEALKHLAIQRTVENALLEYTGKSNAIAESYGIQYGFSIPDCDWSMWAKELTEPSVIALFQGYPICEGNGFYNKFAFSGAYRRNRPVLYIEDRQDCRVYHYAECPRINTGKEWEVHYSTEECATAGAYACDICSTENGYSEYLQE